MKLKPTTMSFILILIVVTACVVVIGKNNQIDNTREVKTDLDLGVGSKNKNKIDSIKIDTTKLKDNGNY